VVAFIRVEDTGSSILTVPALGGPERKLRTIDTWFGSALSWSQDGTALAFSDRTSPDGPYAVFRLELASLQVRRLSDPTPAYIGDAFPAFSPDGRTIAFARISASGGLLIGGEVSIMPASGGEPRMLDKDPSVVGGLDWSPDGRSLVFSSARTFSPRLWRVDVEGGAARPQDLGEDPRISNATGPETVTDVSLPFRVSIARSGTRLAYARSAYDTDIWGVDLVGSAAGRPRKVVATTRLEEAPQFSPDGRRIAFSSARTTTNPEIWICDSDGTNCFQLTSLGVPCGTPRWSPDGRRIAFDAPPAGNGEVFTVDVDTRLARRLTDRRSDDGVPSWSRSGRWIYFASDLGGSWQVWKLPADGGKPFQVTAQGGFAAFESGDGQWLYYTRPWAPGLWRMPAGGGAETRILDVPHCWGYWGLGPDGIYVLDAKARARPTIERVDPATGRRLPVATLAGEPACGEPGLAISPDGRSLLYVDAVRTSDLMLVENFR
jgi:Tol biopolymer transport system component